MCICYKMCMNSTKIFFKNPLTLCKFPIIIMMFAFVGESVCVREHYVIFFRMANRTQGGENGKDEG